MITLLSNNLIDKSQKSLWDHGNNFLYDLCSKNFEHTKEDVIVTKVLFIGRIYAAALERNKIKKDENNTSFYFKTVAPKFKNSEIDKRLRNLKSVDELTADNIPSVLETHNYLMETINKITGHNNRSFCSKYLHFHLPNLFFIYDSIALKNLRKYISKVPDHLNTILKCDNIDEEYAKFFCKCYDLKQKIEKDCKTKLTLRKLDNLLLEVN